MARLLCEKCKRKCRGDVLRVFNKYFHKGCFTCSKCSKSLESGGFFVKDDKFYCQADYQKYFSAKCKVCTNDLVGEIVTVLNFCFHRECFKCSACSLTFNPGDRVTVWKEQFFCPDCIRKQPLPLSPSTQPPQNGNDVSPISVTDDEGCISAADGSPSEGAVSPQYPTSKFVKLESEEKVRLNSPETKCILSTSNPQKSKSILRKAGGDHLRTSSREHGYLSTDSGLGERLFDSRIHEDTSRFSVPEQTNGNDSYSRPVATPSTTISANLSRQSLLSRVPNSDYGRFLNQSYMHLTQQPPVISPPVSHQYKRTGPAAVSSRFSRPHHFHIPDAKSRFLPPGTRTSSILFGQSSTGSMSSQLALPRTQATMSEQAPAKQLAKSAFELRGLAGRPTSPSSKGLANGHTKAARSGELVKDEQEDVTLEARRLACYPAGHARDKTVPAPIERYDWPAPPASAVVLAELMRERRCRRRDQTHLNGMSRANGDEFESQELLSIDDSFDGRTDTTGIGKAILREEAEQKRRCQSQLLDPVSASRSPNAAVEPVYKPRFSTHQFACQPIRPGYTGGRLAGLEKTSSLPASSLLLNSAQSGATDRSCQNMDHDGTDQHHKRILPCNRPYYHSVHALSATQSQLSNGYASNLRPSSSSVAVRGGLHGESLQPRDDELAYPNVLYSPTPSAAFHKCEPPAPKIIPYEELKTYRERTPKGIDRTALEAHLSAEEFQHVFRLSRSAFYRLPEWKRNDLKRRVELF